MSEGMPRLIAAEIDAYDQVLQRAIKAEQELAAANAELIERRGIARKTLNVVAGTYSDIARLTICLGILESLAGELA